MVIAFYRDLVGVSVCCLDFMNIEPGGEEHQGLAFGSQKSLIDICRHPAGAGKHPQRWSLEDGKVAVTPPHTHHGFNLARVALIIDSMPVLDCPNLKMIRRIDETIVFPIACSMPQHG